jgi:hypothetical protein
VGVQASRRRTDDTGAESEEARCPSRRQRMPAERAATYDRGSSDNVRESALGSCTET